MRTSAGAMLDMPFALITNVFDVINELKFANFGLYGTDLKGENLTQVEHKKIALFLGNEATGLPTKVLKRMDKIFTIPQKRAFDSLNVGTAGAILMDRISNGRA